MWAVVPVKEIGAAKQRLAGHLAPEDRRQLVVAMLGDVLEALSAVESLEGVLVVTRDADAARLAREHGAAVLDEAIAGGLNAALEQAAAHLEELGARGMLVVPGDLPCVSATDARRVLEAHDGDRPAMTVVTDRHQRGTNCLACSPPDLCRFRFGTDSFAAHRRAASEAGVEPRVLPIAGLEMDVDTPADIDALADRSLGRRTRRLLRTLPVSAAAFAGAAR